MAKYHFNPSTGETGVCGAKIRCRFKLSEDQHFDSAEEASLAFEATQSDELFIAETKAPKISSTRAYILRNLPMTSLARIEKAQELMNDFNIDDYASEIEIPNSSSTGDNYVTLQDIKDNSAMMPGNCGAVAHALTEELAYDFSEEGVDFTTTEVKYNDGYSHYANKAVFPNGEVVMIDYTANQYNKEIPTPYIAGVKEWAEVINNNVNRKNKTEITVESLKKLT